MPVPLLPPEFYSELNQLIDDYQKDPKEAKLDHMYDLIQDRFQQVDISSEAPELDRLRFKLKDAHVDENHKLMRFLQEALNSLESQEVPSSINWKNMLLQDPWKEIFAYLGEDLSKIQELSKHFSKDFSIEALQTSLVERYASKLSVQQLIALSQFCSSSVKKFDLRNLEGLTDRQLASLVEAYPMLQTLDLSGCYQITDKGLASLAKLEHLQTLHLSECREITDQGLVLLVPLPHLQALNLSGCYQITDQGLTLLAKLQQLQTLDLSFCTRIADQGLAFLAKLQQLQTLNVSFCSQITAQGLASLTQLKNLQTLNLSFCPQITDQELALLAPLLHLRELDLSFCNQITDKGLQFLFQLPNLQTLHLSGCTHITDNGLKSIKIKNIIL
jgi:predicted transcriptional regulator